MILSVAGISFRYNSHPVLRNVSFELEPGRILTVLGVNGAGKSTLLKCVNRILRPQRGVVLLEGRNVESMKAREVATRFGYVPQQHEDEPVSVFDAVLLGRKPHIRWTATQRDYRVVERVLRLMHLEELALRPVNTLSGGETQKVLFARALAQEPDVLLLDEPTSNLDLRNQLQTMHLIRDAVASQGLSAIVSIHDLNLALRLGGTFLLLKEGRVHALVEGSRLTGELIREVFGVEVVVGEVAGVPVVVMQEETEPSEADAPLRSPDTGVAAVAR